LKWQEQPKDQRVLRRVLDGLDMFTRGTLRRHVFHPANSACEIEGRDALNRFVVRLAYCLRMAVSYLSYLEWALEVWGLQHGTTSWCAVNRTHSRISDYLATNGFS
jgi:hypothetical protein